jgi:hypothetical protein
LISTMNYIMILVQYVGGFYHLVHELIVKYNTHLLAVCLTSVVIVTAIVVTLIFFKYFLNILENIFVCIWWIVRYSVSYLYRLSTVRRLAVPIKTDFEKYRDLRANLAEIETKLGLSVSQSVTQLPAPLKEMAVEGSTMIQAGNSETYVPGTLSIRSANHVVTSMGCRIMFEGKSCLLTANHTYEHRLLNGSCFLEHYGKEALFNPEEWKILVRSPTHHLDVVILEEPPAFFTALGVKALKCRNIKPDRPVMIYGYHDEHLKFSFGSYQKSKKAFVLKHWASTQNGWSGSPLIQDGYVVGVHTGASKNLKDNVGTSCFWLSLSGKESDNDHVDKDVFVSDFTEEQERRLERSLYSIRGKKYVVENFGRNLKVKGLDTGFDNWYDDIPDDMNTYELGFPTSVVPAPPVINKAAKNQDSSHLCDGCGKRSPEPKPQTTHLFSGQKRIRVLNSSGSVAPTKSRTEKSSPRELGSKKSVNARIGRLERELQVSLKHLRKLVPKETLCESGIIPLETPNQKDVVSCSNQQDSTVRLLTLTRKQEKLYNKICHTRRYQQALRDPLNSNANPSLRARTLEFVTSSTIALRENPLQDFLSTL